jgi:vacuolar-type H+-ATPase subunit E/Vma4
VNLEPLREALRAEVDAEVQERLAAVDAECARTLSEAEATAHDLAGQARREGEEAAAKEATRRRATAMRRAREIRLRAQSRLLDELELRSREAVLGLTEEGRYPQLLDRLAGVARDQLGPGAEVEIDPAGRGGVIGRKGAMSVDYTLPALADRAVASLGDEPESLWR